MANEIAIIETAHTAGLPSLAALEIETPAERLRGWLGNLGDNTARSYARDLVALAEHLGCLPRRQPGNRLDRHDPEAEHVGMARALTALCGARRSVALTALERYRDEMLSAGLASATINRRLSAANSALAELAKADLGHGRLDVRPVPQEARRDTKGPSVGRVERVVDNLASRTDAAGARDLAIVLLAAQRGLRRSEIAGLRLEDLKPAECVLMVRRKGRRELVAVQIAPATCEALHRWLEARECIAQDDVEAVFVGIGNKWRGRPMGDHAVYDIIRKAGKSIGAEWHPHDLRHTAITEALRRCNGSLPAAQAFAGHAAPQTTSRYLDDKGRLERQAVDAMGDAFVLPKRLM